MIDAQNQVLGQKVSRETFEKLEEFASLLEKWTKSINLIAPKTVPEIWERHILDSAQLFFLAPHKWTSWIDLGSGGGLPAIVISILDLDQRPITLVESDQRKCLFLRTVKRELELNIHVENQRIENLTIEPATVISARALAPLPDLLSFSERILTEGGTALFAKGENYQSELDQAQKNWHFGLSTHTSYTSPNSRILELSRIHRRES